MYFNISPHYLTSLKVGFLLYPFFKTSMTLDMASYKDLETRRLVELKCDSVHLCRWNSALLACGCSHIHDVYLQAVLAQEVPASFS